MFSWLPERAENIASSITAIVSLLSWLGVCVFSRFSKDTTRGWVITGLELASCTTGIDRSRPRCRLRGGLSWAATNHRASTSAG